ncbi:MAG: type II toxin-antitoxin system RelE/ParE family toxin [Mucilaginibacter sp.]|uniref:type II toxin-antitoxin system RelE/ParE family toxin n=1 Tax=Mucilaginibacter sp. TaxID=1882438 RepID=UPI003262EEC3
MAKVILLSPVAEQDYEAVLDYLFNKFGITVMTNFIDRFEKVCDLISQDPEIYPYLNKRKQIRKCVVTKHNIIYFIEFEDTIRVITVFDTRQDPDKLDLHL